MVTPDVLLLGPDSVRRALATLGEVLRVRRASFALVAIGGSSLLLQGVIRRATRDVDIIATVDDSGAYRRARELPPALAAACADVAGHLGLASDWLNTKPASVMDHGLPIGFESRVDVLDFGPLRLHLAGRFDQVCLKLHAAVDRGDPHGKHVEDLRALAPTREDLMAAARWTRTHDPSPGFRSLLVEALRSFGVEDADDHLG